MEKERTELNSDLLRAVRNIAREEDRDEREVLEEAVSLFLSLRSRFVPDEPDRDVRRIYASSPRFRAPGSFREYFEEAARWQEENGVEPLSDEEAMKLADEELHAMRRERDERERAGR
ncbi:MAG: hypothetical protein H0U65_16725 [Rubrobacter sp.]|jgi:hypothetical protein|nr:hypothetical protein [Rubrobacter sp.]